MTTDVTLSAELRRELERTLHELGTSYAPRTRHLLPDGAPKFVNRLLLEASPYLRQHAHNPVNWFPWGDEPFVLAKSLARPVFLSVGYATCHWCHVMEEESFEDEAIAAFLNEHYICIKLDREERPDIDAVYMTAVNLLTGRGGWPMSVWLTPERLPFFAGTYYPPRDGERGMRRGFLSLLQERLEAFLRLPESVAAVGAELSLQIQKAITASRSGDVDATRALQAAIAHAERSYDSKNGGSTRVPKFPSSFPVRLLLRDFAAHARQTSLELAETTLRCMARGGIYDQIAGGFHRYSTDGRWLVPHFEKMLYDNALLVRAYLDGLQATGNADFENVVRQTLAYIAREMTAPSGGFYSATDADSLTPSGRRDEGYFFTWTPEELGAVLEAESAHLVEAFYGVEPDGNFEGRSILYQPRSKAAVAGDLNLSEVELEQRLELARQRLLSARQTRPAPLLDDKIQTDWNGLMISAFARAALVLNEPGYAARAVQAAEFLLSELRSEGRLKHSAVGRKLGHTAFLCDYAFLSAGLLDLFEATGTSRWLTQALALLEELELLHVDAEHGGYFTSASDQDVVLAREKPSHDGAIPNGNSAVLLSQARAYALTGDDKWRRRAEATQRAFAATLHDLPAALYEMLLAVDFMLADPLEVAIIVPDAQLDAGAAALLRVWRQTFAPNQVLVVTSEAQAAGELARLIPWLHGKVAGPAGARAYVCRQGACELPTSEPEVLAQQLLQARRR